MENTSKTFIVTDEVTGEKLEVEVSVGTYGLEIKPKGYEAKEDTSRVNLDFFDDKLSVIVYQDAEADDYSHKIILNRTTK